MATVADLDQSLTNLSAAVDALKARAIAPDLSAQVQHVDALTADIAAIDPTQPAAAPVDPNAPPAA